MTVFVKPRHILCALLVMVAACSQEEKTSDVVRIDPATAAVVNGEPIFIADVELEALAQGYIQRGDEFGPEHEAFGRILDQLIDQRLLAQEAQFRGLEDDEQARHRLEFARERILGNILIESLVADRVTEETIRKMYDEQVALQQLGDEVRLARIVVDEKDVADEIAAKLADGDDFATLAFQYSTDLANRVEGGELGWVPVANLAEPYVGEVGNTPVGTVSAPFETDEGWILLKVQERRKQAPKTLEEMRPDIVRFLTLSEINKVLRELRANGQVQRMATPGTDNAIEEANRVVPAPQDDSLLQTPEDAADTDTPDEEGSGD